MISDGYDTRCKDCGCWPRWCECPQLSWPHLATNFELIGKVVENWHTLVMMDRAMEHCVCGAHEKSEFAQLKRELADARVGDALVQEGDGWRDPDEDHKRLYCAVVVLSEFLGKFIGRRFVSPDAVVSVALNAGRDWGVDISGPRPLEDGERRLSEELGELNATAAQIVEDVHARVGSLSEAQMYSEHRISSYCPNSDAPEGRHHWVLLDGHSIGIPDRREQCVYCRNWRQPFEPRSGGES